MVLPFAGLELLALGAAFYHCALRSSMREVITIQEGTIAVQRGRYGPRETTAFPREWARVELAQARRRGHPTRLLIYGGGREIEVGSCLNDDERARLAVDLREWIAPLLPRSA